jgi:Domain of unknown function (DUF4331)
VRLWKPVLLSGAVALAAGAMVWSTVLAPLTAADHFDPPQRVDPAATTRPDLPADIADIYLYHTATSLIVSMGFSGPQATNLPASYDRDVLYNIMLSNAGTPIDTEFNIEFRFGQDRTNPAASGIRIAGLPGVAAPLVGPVESTLTTANGIKVFVGLIDDPFNFDAVGFRLTRESGNLMIDRNRNRFTGLNTTAVVIEIPLSLIRNGTNPITAWGTTARIIPA